MLRTHSLLFFISTVDEPSNITESLKYERVMLLEMFLNFHSLSLNGRGIAEADYIQAILSRENKLTVL